MVPFAHFFDKTHQFTMILSLFYKKEAYVAIGAMEKDLFPLFVQQI